MSNRMLMGVLTVALASAPATLQAQDWRDVSSHRQRGDESRLDVRVRYGAGELRVQPGGRGELYRVAMRYDADLFTPITDYRGGRLQVGVEGTGKNVRLRNNESGELTLALSPDVELDLAMEFGAVEANLELGGLRVRSVELQTGASQTHARFSRPNAIECDRLKTSVGAAAFQAEGLGNAGCRRLELEGGVGDMSLDFSGEWRRDMQLDVSMALGSLTLSVPENIGVRVERNTFLTGFDSPGFVRRDGVYYSENWDRAEHRLSVALSGAFGSARVRWIAPTAPATR